MEGLREQGAAEGRAWGRGVGGGSCGPRAAPRMPHRFPSGPAPPSRGSAPPQRSLLRLQCWAWSVLCAFAVSCPHETLRRPVWGGAGSEGWGAAPQAGHCLGPSVKPARSSPLIGRWGDHSPHAPHPLCPAIRVSCLPGPSPPGAARRSCGLILMQPSPPAPAPPTQSSRGPGWGRSRPPWRNTPEGDPNPRKPPLFELSAKVQAIFQMTPRPFT